MDLYVDLFRGYINDQARLVQDGFFTTDELAQLDELLAGARTAIAEHLAKAGQESSRPPL